MRATLEERAKVTPAVEHATAIRRTASGRAGSASWEIRTGIDKTAFEARACYLGERIDLRGYLGSARIGAQRPAQVWLPDGGVAILYRYGAVVFFDTTPAAERRFITDLAPLVTDAYAQPETEEISIRVAPGEQEGIDRGTLVVKDGSANRLEVIASALSKSVALAQYEADVAANFDQIEPFALQLDRRGRGGRNMQHLLRHIGRALLNEHKMVARVEVSDRPELIWDHPEFKQLYRRLEDELELRERAEILDRKLSLISRTAGTALDLLQKRRSIRVEWYIVALIVLEVILSVYDMFWRSG